MKWVNTLKNRIQIIVETKKSLPIAKSNLGIGDSADNRFVNLHYKYKDIKDKLK